MDFRIVQGERRCMNLFPLPHISSSCHALSRSKNTYLIQWKKWKSLFFPPFRQYVSEDDTSEEQQITVDEVKPSNSDQAWSFRRKWPKPERTLKGPDIKSGRTPSGRQFHPEGKILPKVARQGSWYNSKRETHTAALFFTVSLESGRKTASVFTSHLWEWVPDILHVQYNQLQSKILQDWHWDDGVRLLFNLRNIQTIWCLFVNLFLYQI